MEKYLAQTPMLNYADGQIQELVKSRNWREMNEKNRILSIYNYVRDEIAFGYNVSDNISAAEVLSDGYGQCNTKATLFMALLRAVGIPCRTHGFHIDKKVQKGAMKSFYYALAPKELLHSWVEVFYNDIWLNLEGLILDTEYLKKLQTKFKDCEGSFCGYGVAINDLKKPPIEWDEDDTYIQKDAITKDLGIYDSPDDLFSRHRQKGGRFKHFMFRNIVRRLMNRNVKRMRSANIRY